MSARLHFRDGIEADRILVARRCIAELGDRLQRLDIGNQLFEGDA